MNTKLSEHFSLEEGYNSNTAARLGINNIPPILTIETMRKTAMCMERVRALLDNPIIISSWFRCVTLNRVLKSKDTSQHILGEAVDFICPQFGSPLEVCKKLIEYKELIRFDQLILEHDWIHISFAISTGAPRFQVLSLLNSGRYSSGLTDKKGNPL